MKLELCNIVFGHSQTAANTMLLRLLVRHMDDKESPLFVVNRNVPAFMPLHQLVDEIKAMVQQAEQYKKVDIWTDEALDKAVEAEWRKKLRRVEP